MPLMFWIGFFAGMLTLSIILLIVMLALGKRDERDFW